MDSLHFLMLMNVDMRSVVRMLEATLSRRHNLSPRQISVEAMSSPPNKMQKTVKVIGTHSGSFHCDEALGCYLVKQLDEFKGATIVRSRDPKVLDTCDIVLDVGGTYEPGFNTKLSSAGLAYLHYGRSIIAQIMDLPEGNPDVEVVYLATYKKFMEAIDAIDNGINQWDGSQVPKYVNSTHLSARVGKLNPDWNEDCSDAAYDAKFKDAMALTGSEFRDEVQWISKTWLPARSFVKAAIEKRGEIDPSGKIIFLEQSCPWKEHLYELEEELKLEKPLKYCLYEDNAGKFRVQAVNVPGSFESRKPLPSAWRGVRDEELSQKSGIPGCIFVHASGFIGGNATFKGALQMAQAGLQE